MTCSCTTWRQPLCGSRPLLVDPDRPDVAQVALDRALLAEEMGNLQAAAKEWDGFAVADVNPTISTANPQYICFAALTYQITGQSAKADAALDAVGRLTFVDCYRFRGDLLDLRGDWAGAQAGMRRPWNLPRVRRGLLLLGPGTCKARRS